MSNFKPPEGEVVPITRADLDMASKMCGVGHVIILADLDLRFMVRDRSSGRPEALMWSKQGHRITFSSGGGGAMASRSKDVDPYYPGKAEG